MIPSYLFELRQIHLHRVTPQFLRNRSYGIAQFMLDELQIIMESYSINGTKRLSSWLLTHRKCRDWTLERKRDQSRFSPRYLKTTSTISSELTSDLWVDNRWNLFGNRWICPRNSLGFQQIIGQVSIPLSIQDIFQHWNWGSQASDLRKIEVFTMNLHGSILINYKSCF